MKFFKKRSVWVMLSTYALSWFVVSLIAGNVLESFKGNINTALNLTGTRTEIIEDDEEEQQDTEYFKSDYVKENQYTTDDNGYTHQTYDDAALRAATTAKAEETQREGSVLLWNSSNGLPIAKGKKVSVFSHNSVDWLVSGGGSGASQKNNNSTVLSELTSAGLTINQTLWDFYKSGAGSGKTYTREGNWKMNEVPWSLVNSNCSSSFASYGDAAIIIYSRLTREASNGGNGGDATKTHADTSTGDYFELSNEEKDLLSGVIGLKNSGTFKKVIVLLNTPAGMFMDTFVANKSKIDCLMWTGFTGYQGLHEVAKLLVGDSTPSGRLPDTFAYNTASAPSSVNIEAKLYSNVNDAGFRSNSQQGAYLTYAENIYVGYKYYETRYEDTVLNQGNANSSAGIKKSTNNKWSYQQEVAFPFGYGASYTEFTMSDFAVTKNSAGDYDVTLKVKNTGEKKGKDVVEVYVQRPYTDFDKENGIEQASVNLAGYYKTKELSVNEEVNVKITVRAEAFRTYDAEVNKTYIREKTSGNDAYYITASHDAHEAINNILAKKGKTKSNTNNLMDKDGDASFVAKFDFDTDDLTTYSKSKVTNNTITNQFDDVDWNKYEHKTDATVKYLTRSNWRDSYPTSTVQLSLNSDMIVDLGDTHVAPRNPEDTMPKYSQPQQYTLIDLMGASSDDERWYTLVDQLSQEDQIRLLGSAYFGTIALTSIGKPADVAGDGPLGLKRAFKYDSSIRTMSYPSPTVMAASFNNQLAEEIGELMGEDALHSGATGIYAPGVNIHRSMYGARNWEYHSEDGFLSGIIGKHRVIGSQKKGCYVHMKHFALNDQESYRHGCGIWANEQSIREVYLNAYEYATTEGGCTGFMTSFIRFGTHWSGAHKGLCTNVVRGEWGCKGFIVSDSAWQQYMGVVDGVLAGNDCILYNVDLSMYDEAKTNPTIAKAVRESVKRILYTVGNSNAMNGISSNIRVYEVREWWQVLVSNVQKALGITFATLAVLTLIRFLFNKPLNKERLFNENLRTQASIKSNKTIKKAKGEKHKVGGLFLTTSLLSVLLAVILTPFTMESIKAAMATGNEEEIPLRERLGEGYSQYKLEGEKALIDSNIAQLRLDYEGHTAEETGNPSGTGFVACVNKDGDCSLTFQFNSGEEKEAVLGVCMGRREYSLSVAAMYTIYVNGKKMSFKNTNVVIPEMEEGGIKYYDWAEYDMMMVNLKEGINSITFIKVDSAPRVLNLDYIYLLTHATVVPETRSYNDYVFDCNNGSDPFISSHGGSISDLDYTYQIEGSENKYRYGNCNEAVFTATVVAEEDTMTVLKLINDCRPGRSFSSVSTTGANPYISAITVNGETKNIIRARQVYESQGWCTYFKSSLASIKLNKGENVITFTVAGDNINVCGIALSSPVKIRLKGQGGSSVGSYKFEAEDAQIDTNIATFGTGYEGKTAAQTNNPSGTGFIYNANKTGDLTLTFTFTSPTDGNATLGACFGRREYALEFYNMYKIYVNDTEYSAGNITIPIMKDGGVKYYDWFDQDIVNVQVKAGTNTIVFIKVDGAPKMLNLDYIYLSTDIELDGILTNYKFDVNDSFDPSNEDNDHNPFRAVNGGSVVDSDKNYMAESGTTYRYGNGNGAQLTCTLVVDKAATVVFKLINDCRPKQSPGTAPSVFCYSQQPQENKNPNPYIASFKVNDSTAGVVPSTKTYVSQGWNVFMQCELATINLKAGSNIIAFSIGGDNINYCGIAVDSPTPVRLGSAS